MRTSSKVVSASVLTIALAGAVIGSRIGEGGARAAPVSVPRVRSLEVFHGSPVLVRAGEDVRIPVDVVCATPAGSACDARATLQIRERGVAFRPVSAAAMPAVGFDISAPVARAVSGSRSSGSVAFQVSATATHGRTAFLSETAVPIRPLRVYATERMPRISLPRVRFGASRRGREVLNVAWGTGPDDVGVRPGDESATLGPSSFDITPSGSIVVVDAVRSRVVEFSNSEPVRSIRLHGDPWADVAVEGDGTIYVASRDQGAVWRGLIRAIDRDGVVRSLRTAVPGMPSQIRRSGSELAVRVLPLDGWVPAVGPPDLSRARVSTGRPLGGGARQLVVAGTQRRVRIGFVRNARVRWAVELTSHLLLGGIQLAQPDGAGGIWVVVRVERDGVRPADRFQVIHVTRSRHVSSFVTPSGDYAEAMALSRFRIGFDGELYQMRSSAEGFGVFRYDLEEAA